PGGVAADLPAAVREQGLHQAVEDFGVAAIIDQEPAAEVLGRLDARAAILGAKVLEELGGAGRLLARAFVMAMLARLAAIGNGGGWAWNGDGNSGRPSPRPATGSPSPAGPPPIAKEYASCVSLSLK